MSLKKQNQPQEPKKTHLKPLKSSAEQPVVCTHCGASDYRKNGRNKGTRTQIYECKRCGRTFTPAPEKAEIVVDPQAEYDKDIWDARRLGFADDVGKTSYKLNFTTFSQSWMKHTVKLHLKACLGRLTFGSVQEKIYALKHLSRFLAEAYPLIDPSDIDRNIMIEFRNYVCSLNLSPSTQSKLISEAKLYFEACYQNEWLDVRRYLVRSEDIPKIPKALPRFIPEVVMQQLNKHIEDLPEPAMRMVLVLQECGMRISELVRLKFNCLLQDKAGDWFLRYYQFKMKKEITIPISREVVRVIQEQKRYIRQHLDEEFEYLFCANGGARLPNFKPVPRCMTRDTLPSYLNKLSQKHDFRGENGEPWHFQTHQFRHTVGTRMINNGVPQHIVQRYLGHESPAMTATYAQIHDKTMKAEIEKFQGKVVNIAGEVVESKTIEADNPDLQWVKRNIQAQALPNGTCALPVISKGCPHANACLTCTHFRTSPEHLPTHKQERDTTVQVIAKAEANGWTRMKEMNEKKLESLNNIITALEGGEEDGCQA